MLGQQHKLFNKTTEKFQEVYDFAKEGLSMLYATNVVYIESKDVILMFGGSNFEGDRDAKIAVIREYSFKTGKWTIIEGIDFPYYWIRALVTKNEKHVILVPNGDNDGLMLILDILDDGKYKLRESDISMPKPKDKNVFGYDWSVALLGNAKGMETTFKRIPRNIRRYGKVY